MDFMDDDMKTIARKAYRQPGGLYAACEAVLAEQKRREAHEATSEVAQKIGNQMLQNLRRNVSEERKQEPQMDATMADEVRQPAEDVVRKVAIAIGWNPAALDWTGSTGRAYLAQAAAALAVAREGMVPASELERVEKKLVLWGNRMCELNDENAELKQQLATTYSLEQTLDSLSDKEIKEIEHIFGDCAKQQIDYMLSARRARLIAKPQPTEQEPSKWVNISYYVSLTGLPPSICGLCGAAVFNQFGHTEWHNNLLAALGEGRQVK